MSVGWGVIGIGYHADSRMVPAIVHASGGRLAAVQSRDQGRADAFAAKHGAERAYTSYDAMLADPNVQVVYVGSPNGLHAEHAIQAARSGKHVFVDKPMATSAADCETMVQSCREAGVQLGVGFNQRFQPAHRLVRDMLQRGDVGKVVLIKIEVGVALVHRLKDWWYDPAIAGAGGLMATGTHAIDLVRWITGSEYVSVAAMTDVTDEHPIDDVAAATMRLANGVIVQMTCGRKLPWPSNDLTVHGMDGQIKATGTMIYDIGGTINVLRSDTTHSHTFTRPRPEYDIFTAEVEQFNRVVSQGEAIVGSGDDGVICTRIVEAIQESARNGRTISV